ncbi:response regulator transcription factor [Sphingomonas sp. QA11]|uniref:response regulator transcription factor n=1 Tax=Sphingomonas sp. QA11 TaxID=2950605 RepID=UPI00234B497A|nr:response regulator transcription factor [Sphingomonas sp. QA11]WCM28630.1 response regulator transcription factor [Sphingomonas sp. QA11]
MDDDDEIRDLVREQLVRAGFEVETAGDVRQATLALSASAIDIVILDLTLPDGDGIDLCQQLRTGQTHPAIIIVSARDAAADRILGLETGADDYLVKPFEPRELIARVRGLLRRVQGSQDDSREVGARFARFGPWRLDLVKRRLVAPDDSVVVLPSGDYEVLLRFVRAPHSVLQRDDLAPERKMTVWLDRSLDSRIYRIRRRLAREPGGEDLILSVRNQGYCLASDVEFL